AAGRREHERRFRARDRGRMRAGVLRKAACDIEGIEIRAHAEDAAEPWRPSRFCFDEHTAASFIHPILPNRVVSNAALGPIESDWVDDIGPRLKTELERVIQSEGIDELRMCRRSTEDRAVVGLVELIAASWVVEEEGEVGEERQVRANAVHLN